MMRNTTLNRPDGLVQHARSYAAQHGTTMTALIRDNLERITGYQAEPPRSDDPVVAFSEGRMAAQAAMEALGLRDYPQLLPTLGERGVPLPRLPRHEVEAMADTLVGIYRQEHGR